MIKRSICAFIAAFLFLPALSSAHNPEGYTIEVFKTPKAPVIDGKMSDWVWSHASSTEGEEFKVWAGGKTDGPAKNQTVVYVAWDDDALYVLYECQEPNPKKLKTVVRNRDGSPIWEDDEIELFLDVEHDGAAPYFQFIVNAANVQFDLWKGQGDVGWNGEWESGVTVGTDEWIVELAIPFKTLNVDKPKDGDIWGVNFTRHVMTVQPTEWTTWATMGARGFHMPELFGDMIFKEESLEVSPLGKAALTWGEVKAGE